VGGRRCFRKPACERLVWLKLALRAVMSLRRRRVFGTISL
jgi:hypothetical protein